jgi:transcriptional regulator with XRE-family HTH domain
MTRRVNGVPGTVRAMSYAQRTTHAARDHALTSLYGVPMPPSDRGRAFAALLLAARKRKGLRQEDVAERSGVSRRTLTRWEGGNAEKTDPDGVRAVCDVLGIDLTDAAIALGYVDPGPRPEPPPDPTLEEVLDMFRDPRVPEEMKFEALRYLRYLRTQPAGPPTTRPGEIAS